MATKKREPVVEPKETETETGDGEGQGAGAGNVMQKYLDRAVSVLGKFTGNAGQDTNAELIRLLEEVKHLDEPKVLAISRTISYMSRFNQLVRDNVENIDVGQRYLEIAQMF
ncbi:MAG: cell surface protein, partial [Isosphaeraceae bacterium]